jgi:phage gp16-like protein
MSKNFPESERRRLLAKIHIAKKQLDWDDDQYRAALKEIAGVDSAGKLTVKGFKDFLDYLYRCGFKDGAPQGKRLSPRSSDKPHKTRQSKAVALWIELYKAEKVKDRSHDALGSFVRRFLGDKVTVLPGADPLDAASPEQLGKVIKALEGWLNGSATGTEEKGVGAADNAADSDGVSDASP